MPGTCRTAAVQEITERESVRKYIAAMTVAPAGKPSAAPHLPDSPPGPRPASGRP